MLANGFEYRTHIRLVSLVYIAMFEFLSNPIGIITVKYYHSLKIPYHDKNNVYIYGILGCGIYLPCENEMPVEID